MPLLRPAPAAAEGGPTETVDQAVCRLIETAAARHALPVDILTRLIWRESTFRPDSLSPKGAQGIAQFMPGTASERGLADPFDIEAAIPAAAGLLDELRDRLGNLGLAAAAYNAGPTRVARWLDHRGGLPGETRDYVLAITGRDAEGWAEAARKDQAAIDPAIKGVLSTGDARYPRMPEAAAPRCGTLVAGLRRGTAPLLAGLSAVGFSPLSPWGVQLAGNFSKTAALRSFGRAQSRYGLVLAGIRPMVIGTRLRSRGTRAFYRVRAPAPTRAAADTLCRRIRVLGGPCLVLRS